VVPTLGVDKLRLVRWEEFEALRTLAVRIREEGRRLGRKVRLDEVLVALHLDIGIIRLVVVLHRGCGHRSRLEVVHRCLYFV